MLQRYGNRAGNSGVKAFEELPEAIRVQFIDGEVYTYTYGSAGRRHVEFMKALARQGKGLSGYIAVNVRHRYATKTGGNG